MPWKIEIEERLRPAGLIGTRAVTASLLCITDGRRDCLERTIASFDEMVTGPIGERIMVSDGDAAYTRWLEQRYGQRFRIVGHETKQGFCRTWRHAFELADPANPWVVMLEDDFLVRRPIDLADVIGVLIERPHLAQMVFVRQPWNERERAAGGVMQTRQSELRYFDAGPTISWMEGRAWFSTNVNVTRAEVLAGWDDGPECEGKFTAQLLAHGWGDILPSDVAFGYWGRLDDPPTLHHIGDERTGCGY